MKYIFFAITMLFLTVKCKKNQSLVNLPIEPIDTVKVPVDSFIIELGKAFVLKNGIPWNAPFESWYHKNTRSRFQIRAKITSPSLRSESLFLHDVPCKIGKYPIEFYAFQNGNNQIPDCIFIIMQDYDQPVGDYMVDTTRTDHFMEVIRYDSVARTVEGRFQVFLGKKPVDVPWPGAPDSVLFTQGKFHLKVQNP